MVQRHPAVYSMETTAAQDVQKMDVSVQDAAGILKVTKNVINAVTGMQVLLAVRAVLADVLPVVVM